MSLHKSEELVLINPFYDLESVKLRIDDIVEEKSSTLSVVKRHLMQLGLQAYDNPSSLSPVRGKVNPQTEEHYQGVFKRDQELILEQRDEIAQLKGKLNKLEQGKVKKFKKPTKDEANKYFDEIGSHDPVTEGNAFIDHFDSNGWKVGGKTPMKDWKAAIRTWVNRRNKENEKAGRNTDNKSNPVTDYTGIANRKLF